MSFLNSVLSSIDTGDVSSTPARGHKSTSVTPSASGTKPTSNQTPVTHRINNGHSISSQKRKASGDLHRPANRVDKVSKPSPLPIRPTPHRSAPTPPLPKRTMTPAKPVYTKPSNTRSLNNIPKASNNDAAPSKLPPKGSYADIMLQAKALQNKAPSNVGMIKHQAVSKERLSKVQQKRLAKETKQRELENKKNPSNINVDSGGKVKESILKARAAKDGKQTEYKGTARPPSHSRTTATATAKAEPTYSGTAGLSSRRALGKGSLHDRRNQRRQPVRDDYLGTDEEDEAEYGYYDEGDYSDQSSDMEAGYTAVEDEEQTALQIAKKEDEEELRKELAAKKEKLERKRKLGLLAARPR